jgi:hypothetical protein
MKDWNNRATRTALHYFNKGKALLSQLHERNYALHEPFTNLAKEYGFEKAVDRYVAWIDNLVGIKPSTAEKK